MKAAAPEQVAASMSRLDIVDHMCFKFFKKRSLSCVDLYA